MDDLSTIKEHLAINETKIEAFEKRLEVCEETTKALNSLTQSITKMDATLEHTNSTVRELKEDVHELKEKPTKRWDGLTTAIISAIAGAIISFIAAGLL